MSRISEDALRRGLEAANLRIISLEKQLVEAKKVVLVKAETRADIEIEAETEIDETRVFKAGKKNSNRFKKD